MVKELYMEHEATQEEAVAVQAAFSWAGFPVTIKRGLDGPPGEWGVVFSATVPLPIFFAAFPAGEANDPYIAVKTWAQRIFEARRGPRWKRGAILIHGPRSSVYLWSDMPDRAFDSLAGVDSIPSPVGCYEWDAGRNEWRERFADQRRWPKWLLLGVVAAALLEIRRRRRAD
jgi:hypothetical protein